MSSANPPWIHAHGVDTLVDVVVSPRASRCRIMGVFDGRLKIQLTASPIDNRANDALVRFLAQVLAAARAQVEIVGGQGNRRKTVRLVGIGSQRVLLALSPKQC